MAQPRPEDIRKTEERSDPQTGAGDGAAYRGGYGAGGLGGGAERARGEVPTWDAPGVTPDGRRTGSSQEGPRIPMDDESDPNADLPDEPSAE